LVGYLMILRAPDRFDGYLALNMAHPWVTPRVLLPQLWRFLYQPPLALFGVALQQRTPYIERVIFGVGGRGMDSATARVYAERFREPVVARAGRDTYRTFLVREIPGGARHPETRRATVPIRALFGVNDFPVHPSLADPETANADDYTLETVDGAAHFIIDERPDLVRAKLITLADETRR
ncbi:MAG TPA: alpha/beta hydrolase, partial [Mycobacterium sp.]|nr:alpha/beta hydrolase [Mycobacterium sp.]